LLGGLDEFQSRFDDDVNGAGALSSIVGSLILRRRIEDVASDLPERIDIDVPIDAGPDFHNEYAQLRERIIAKYPQAGHLVAVNQLSMYCTHHAFAERDGVTIEDAVASLSEIQLLTPKLEATLELLYEAFMNGRKVLIFSRFNGTIQLFERVAGTLPPAFWNAINGSTPQPQRQKIVEDFSQYDGPGCLILNPDAAGTGLNITAATIVIHFTLYWNPAREAQASARAHRRGQTQPVRIYRLYYPDTVEEVMLERSLRRREIGDAVMQDAEAEKADLRKAMEMGRRGNGRI
jgi:SNF2 family DNA or RNA helicase